MTQVLRIKRMPVCQLAHVMDVLLANDLVAVGEPFADKRVPVLLGDRSERIMSTRPIEGTGAIREHFLDQMFAAAEKDIAHVPMILDHAPQLPFYLVIAVFENLLKLVEHHYHVQIALRRNLGRGFQHFIQRRTEFGEPADSEHGNAHLPDRGDVSDP